MRSKFILLGALLNLLLVATPRAQEPIPFTIDTLAAKTPFGFGVFTADRMTVQTYVIAIGGDSQVNEESFQKVTGFTLRGAPVEVKGLNSSFSLYLKTNTDLYNPYSKDSEAFYTPGAFQLLVDVGNDDGPIVFHPHELVFGNVAGTRNDEYLARYEGSVGNTIVSGSVSHDPDGTRHDHFSGGPLQAPSDNPEVLVSPLRSQVSEIKEELNTPPSAFHDFHMQISNWPPEHDFTITGGSGYAYIVPEPAPAALGLAGLAFAAGLCPRSRRRATRPAGISGVQLDDSAAAVTSPGREKSSGKQSFLLGALLSLFFLPRLHAQEPFTINTLRAAIPFGSGAFTADNMQLKNYVSAIDGEVFFLQKVTGFTLHGAPVTVPDLNSSFSLYWEGFGYLQGVFTNKDGSQYYDIINLALVVDLGNNDGTPMIDTQQRRRPFFSNPAGATTDEVVAYGSAEYNPQDPGAGKETAVSHDPDHTRHDNLPVGVLSTDKESPNFLSFPSFSNTPLFLERLTTRPNLFAYRLCSNPKYANFTINGGTGRLFVVPEPTPVALAAAGLAFAATLCHFRRRRTSRHTS